VDHPLTGIPGLFGVAAAGVLAALDQLPLLTDAVIGAAAGVVVAKLLVGRLERRHGELAAPRVRQLGLRWTVVGIGFALLIYVREGLL